MKILRKLPGNFLQKCPAEFQKRSKENPNKSKILTKILGEILGLRKSVEKILEREAWEKTLEKFQEIPQEKSHVMSKENTWRNPRRRTPKKHPM